MLVYLNQSFDELKMQATERGTKISMVEFRNALLAGAGMRVRPVMMTVATIILGLLPVLYGEGTGSEVMSRVAAPMVGGMTSAVILTLVVLPALYLLVKKPQVSVFNRSLNHNLDHGLSHKSAHLD